MAATARTSHTAPTTRGARQPGSGPWSASTIAQLTITNAVTNATAATAAIVRLRNARRISSSCLDAVSWSSRRREHAGIATDLLEEVEGDL